MTEHEDLPYDENHLSYSLSYADVTAREAASLLPADIGRIARQLDTETYWMLVDDSPLTWKEITFGTGAQVYRNVASHTDTTWYSLFTDGVAEQLLLPPDTAWTLKVLVVGLTAGAAERWSYELNGFAVNDGGAMTVVSGTPVDITESDAAYDVQLVADDTNDAVEVQVRRNGGSDYDIKWRATVLTAEEVYA